MTMTLSGTSGIVLPTAAAPAFSAYLSSSQSIANATFTKVQCNTEEFDTNSNYDKDTNYRFQPTVAGYYQISGSVNFGSAATGICLCMIYKNGTRFKDSTDVPFNASGVGTNISALIYLNGSTDYVELYGYQTGGSSASLFNTAYATYFQGVMVRSA